MAHWFLFRRQRAYNAIEYAIYTASPDACNWTPEQIRRLSFAERYRTQAERGLKRALGLVDAWKRNQRREADRLTRQSQWEANYAIRERRMTLQEEKFRQTQARQAARAAIRSAKNAVSSPATPIAVTSHSISSQQHSIQTSANGVLQLIANR